MLNDFYTISAYQEAGDGLSCMLGFNAAHEIFAGHFPQQPVVPGVCTMHIVKTLLEAALGRKLTLKESGTVKFLRLITPDLSPDVFIDWKEDAGAITASATLKVDDAAVFKMNALYSLS